WLLRPCAPGPARHAFAHEQDRQQYGRHGHPGGGHGRDQSDERKDDPSIPATAGEAHPDGWGRVLLAQTVHGVVVVEGQHGEEGEAGAYRVGVRQLGGEVKQTVLEREYTAWCAPAEAGGDVQM